jgi:hypothetical protein
MINEFIMQNYGFLFLFIIAMAGVLLLLASPLCSYKSVRVLLCMGSPVSSIYIWVKSITYMPAISAYMIEMDDGYFAQVPSERIKEIVR